MIEAGRPAWPTRSPIDPACVRAFFQMCVDAVLDWYCRDVVARAIADIKKENERAAG